MFCSKVDVLLLDRTLPQLIYMFDDENVTVTKRVASAVISLYPLMLKVCDSMYYAHMYLCPFSSAVS